MPKKKVFALRIDEDDYQAMERWAADEFRSINGQLEFIIRLALIRNGRKVKKNDPEKKTDKE